MNLNAISTMRAQALRMVVRTRIRAILYPILLYLLAGSASAYFIWTAVNGDRGLKTRVEYTSQIAALRKDLADIRADRQLWDHRIALMRSESVDDDLLDEQARTKLDYVDPHDLVIFSKSYNVR